VANQRTGVLVVDFGAQYAQLIARRVREASVYSEIVPSHISVAEVKAKNPQAIILSGGPSSVYAENAPTIDGEILKLGIPVFGICYGFQAMAAALGGEVAKNDISEYGRTHFSADTTSHLFTGLEPNFDVWMSHGESSKIVMCSNPFASSGLEMSFSFLNLCWNSRITSAGIIGLISWSLS